MSLLLLARSWQFSFFGEELIENIMPRKLSVYLTPRVQKRDILLASTVQVFRQTITRTVEVSKTFSTH